MAMIHEEWIRSVVRRQPDEQQDVLNRKLLRTAILMDSAILDSLVVGIRLTRATSSKQQRIRFGS